MTKNYMPKSNTIPQAFVLLWLKILVLICWYNTIKKSYKPLTRILMKGSSSFVELIEKRRLISPPSYIYCFFTVNLNPELALLD
jgi:hypothetical protein